MIALLCKFRLVFVGIGLCIALWVYGRFQYSQGENAAETVCEAKLKDMENEALKKSAAKRRKQNEILLNRPARTAVIKRLRDGTFNPGH